MPEHSAGAPLIPNSEETLTAWRAGDLDRLIIEVLTPVIGEPFMYLGRAADLIWMGFGEEIPAPTLRSPDRKLARHCLHAICPLRVDSESTILIASWDIYRRADSAVSRENFKWDERGANLFDVAVTAFWSQREPGFAVLERVSADPMGGLELGLSSGHTIRFFPDESGTREHWRYFRADITDGHFEVLPDYK